MAVKEMKTIKFPGNQNIYKPVDIEARDMINAKYTKPTGGIPETDLSTAVQNKLNDTYILPVASETQLGGVKVVSKTAEMTEPIGIDDDGKLWGKSGGGELADGSVNLNKLSADVQAKLLPTVTTVDSGKVVTVDENGKWVAGDLPTPEFATTEDIEALFAPADELLGTWVFNESITANFDSTVISTRASQPGTTIEFLLNFQSNSSDYKQFAVVYNGSHIIAVYYDNSPEDYGYDSTAFDGTWMDEVYRTITITDTSALTNREQFTTWLKANATKQGG